MRIPQILRHQPQQKVHLVVVRSVIRSLIRLDDPAARRRIFRNTSAASRSRPATFNPHQRLRKRCHLYPAQKIIDQLQLRAAPHRPQMHDLLCSSPPAPAVPSSSAAASPPTRNVSCPPSACSRLPVTGASSRSHSPAPPPASASSAIHSGLTVLHSIAPLPSPRPPAPRPRPATPPARPRRPPASPITTAAPCAASAGVIASRDPSPRNASAFAAVRLYTVSAKPAFSQIRGHPGSHRAQIQAALPSVAIPASSTTALPSHFTGTVPGSST